MNLIEVIDKYSEDIEFLETAYQACNVSDIDILRGDVILRCGTEKINDYIIEMIRLDAEAKEELRKYIVEHFGEKLRNLVLSRLSQDIKNALAIIAKCVLYEKNIYNIQAMFKLSELDLSINELLRLGLLMRVSLSEVIVPEYLIEFLLSQQRELEIDIYDILQNMSNDYTNLALLEIVLFNLRPDRELFRTMYGIDYAEYVKRLHIPRLVMYVKETNNLITNPLTSIEELRRTYHEFKNFKSRNLCRRLNIHGTYNYVKSIRCGTVCTLYSSVEKALIILSPWLVITRKLLQYLSNVPRMIITNIPVNKDFIDRYYTEFTRKYPELNKVLLVFLHEETAYVFKPRKLSRVHDTLLDTLYSSNFEVIELSMEW